jgi:hypothetical protein
MISCIELRINLRDYGWPRSRKTLLARMHHVIKRLSQRVRVCPKFYDFLTEWMDYYEIT